jgi:2-isopropylmalate synthase
MMGNAVLPARQREMDSYISQSMQAESGLRLPPGLRAEFCKIIRSRAPGRRDTGLRDRFEDEYLLREPLSALLIRFTTGHAHCSIADPWIGLYQMRQAIAGLEAHPGEAFAEYLTAMGAPITILDEHSQLIDGTAETAVYLKCLAGPTVWGVGIASEFATATLKAVLSAANRANLESDSRSRPYPAGFGFSLAATWFRPAKRSVPTL